MHKDARKATMEERTNALSNGTMPDPQRPTLPYDWGFATPPKSSTTNISRTHRLKLQTSNLASAARICSNARQFIRSC